MDGFLRSQYLPVARESVDPNRHAGACQRRSDGPLPGSLQPVAYGVEGFAILFLPGCIPTPLIGHGAVAARGSQLDCPSLGDALLGNERLPAIHARHPVLRRPTGCGTTLDANSRPALRHYSRFSGCFGTPHHPVWLQSPASWECLESSRHITCFKISAL